MQYVSTRLLEYVDREMILRRDDEDIVIAKHGPPPHDQVGRPRTGIPHRVKHLQHEQYATTAGAAVNSVICWCRRQSARAS
jgi:hypothetical protein